MVWVPQNPNITMDMIDNNLNKPWDWYVVSKIKYYNQVIGFD